MERRACAEWPTILNPAPGCLPLAVPVARSERVLHVALRSTFEPQPGLERALRSIATAYEMIDWAALETVNAVLPARALLEAASSFQPTLVWMQLQRATSITGDTVRGVKAAAPGVVVVNWDGDQMYDPEDSQFRCFLDIGAEADASLTTNTSWQDTYHRLGAKRPGYLAIGIDDRWGRRLPQQGTPEIVFLANAYNNVLYDRRRALVAQYMRRWGVRFAVYGNGWTGTSARPFVRQIDESDIYASSKAALVMSNHNTLGRYHSDRIWRAMRAGAVCLIEYVPDMEGMGLVDRENCFFWRTEDELFSLTDLLLNHPTDVGVDLDALRANASATVDRLHTWDVRMGELMAIVQAVRAS